MTTIAFIGAGNMNASIIRGLVNSGYPAQHIIVSNPSADKREKLAAELGIKQTASNIEAAKNAELVVLGTKPHFIVEVCQTLAAELDLSDKCFVSVAAGTTIEAISSALGQHQSVVRTMPNTPAQLGLGLTGIYANAGVSDSHKALTEKVMSAAGDIVWLTSEAQIDQITSLSGSGPAYFFLFMEAMQQQALDYGFDLETSRKIVQQTALGAANMVVANQDTDIATLRANVTSKGGTTQAALETFINGKLPELVQDSIKAALQRAHELAQNNQ